MDVVVMGLKMLTCMISKVWLFLPPLGQECNSMLFAFDALVCTCKITWKQLLGIPGLG